MRTVGNWESGSDMTDTAEISQELDRLITQGHQDSSLLPALQKKFPGVTQAEVEAGFDKVIADRGLSAKRGEQEFANDDAPEAPEERS
jgi:hypothetical protein